MEHSVEEGTAAITLKENSKSFFKYRLVTQRRFLELAEFNHSFARQKSRIFFVFLLVILCGEMSFAQHEPTYGLENIKNVIPPSPEASSLGKYAETPISLYTGIPQITVPIYTIQDKGVNIPISLNYHAGGVKVEEHASWVGLGWSLGAGGVITRSVVGLADDENGGYFTQPYNLENLGDLSVLDQKRIKEDVGNNVLDIEPDIYSFSFLGQSEKFIVNKVTRTGIASKKSNLKIEIINFDTPGDSKIKGWKVTDDRGNQYFFEEIEKTRVRSHNAENRSAFVQQHYVSSWFLSRIILGNQSVITFQYQPHASTYYTRQGAAKYSFLAGGTTTLTCEPPKPGYDKYLTHTISGKHIESIWFSSGHVKFVRSVEGRQDMPGDYMLDRIEVYSFQSVTQPIKKSKLQYSYFNSNESLDPPSSGLNFNTDFKTRLRLDRVEELGVVNKSSYSFEYFAGDLPSVFSNSQDHWGFYNGIPNPSLVPLDQDVGYGSSAVSRAVDFTRAKVGTLSKITYPTGGYTEFVYESNEASITDLEYNTYFYPYGAISRQYYEGFGGTVYKEPEEESVLSDTIFVHPETLRIDPFSNIEYSVQLDNQNCDGGDRDCIGTLSVTLSCIDCEYLQTSSFELVSGTFTDGILRGKIFLIPGKTYVLKINRGYEFPNVVAHVSGSFYKPPSSTVPGRRNILVGGLRVKRLDAYASPTTLANSTEYYYRGDLGFVPETAGSYTSSGVLATFPIYDTFNTFLQKKQGIGVVEIVACLFKLRTAGSTIPLGGSEGTAVGYSDVQTFKTDGIEKIKTISSFFTAADYPDQVDYSFPAVITHSNSNLRGMLKSEVKYAWKGNQFIPVSRTKNIYQSSAYEYNPGVRSGVSTFVPSDMGDGDWQYKIYELPSEFVYLKNSLSTSYDGNGSNPITTETDYSYENPSHYSVTKTEFTQSKGHLISTEYKYPHDFQTNPIYQAMVGRYIVGPVVEQTQLNVTLNKPISKVVTDFDLWNSNTFIDVKAVKKAEGGNALETEIIVNEYDANGNVVQYTERSGAVVTILWGYKSQYPVAKIINATYAQAKAVVTQSILDNPTDDASLRTHLNALRSIGGAQVSTYTYKPLIGKTSETDVNSRSVFYQYDEFNRLSVIKDHQGKMIKRICYNYAGQVDDCSDSPSYQLTGITRCKPCEQNSLYTTQILQNERKDMNPYSPTYSQASWIDAGSSPSCVTAVWVATATPVRCVKDGNNLNTGNVEKEEIDVNPCSVTFNQRRWVFAEYNTQICFVCNTASCSGIDKKCFNNVCETGVLVVDTYELDAMGRCIKYYRYEWSDGSQSNQYSEAAQISNCRDTTPNWQLTGNTRCKPCDQNTSYLSQILQNERRDTNLYSPTYNQIQWVDSGTSSSCVTAVWVATATPVRCVKNASNQNTGNVEREEMDVNPCSPILNQRRWVFSEYNPAICPLPCSATNCSGVDKRCVNNNCETGVLVVDTYEPDAMGRCMMYYHYQWSDGSRSEQYSQGAQASNCRDTTPSWQLTGNTRCKPCDQNTSYLSQILQNERRDTNLYSPTYNQIQWVDAGTSSSCVTAVWVATSTPVRCVKNASNQNTGNVEREEMDVNPCSTTFNQRRWVFAQYNTSICPLPVVCNTSNCSGIDKRCVNGACETGVLVVDTYERDEMGRCRKYYHYQWSDGSQSGQYSQAATSSLCN